VVRHDYVYEVDPDGITGGKRAATALSHPDRRRHSDVGVFRPGGDMALQARGVLSHNTILLR